MSVKELLSEVLPIIEENAPTIATAIASPIIGVPELALSVLSEAFGRHVTESQALIDNIKNDKPSPNNCSASSCLRAIQEEHGDNFRKVMSYHPEIHHDNIVEKQQVGMPLISDNPHNRKITVTIEY